MKRLCYFILLALIIGSVAARAPLLDDDDIKCENVRRFGDACAFVENYCGDASALVDYLSFRYCQMDKSDATAAMAAVILIGWLLLLISLLATTAQYFFLPSLEYLSTKMKLSPDVAGITLLAFGNGAPDVFTAIAGVEASDFPLVLGALIGASLFISSVVLGTVILASDAKVNRISFLRDVSVYIIASATIVIIALDGKIDLFEAIAFIVIYFAYVLLVIFLSRRYHAQAGEATETYQRHLDHELGFVANESQYAALEGSETDSDDDDYQPFAGLICPKKRSCYGTLQMVLEYPFSVARWLTSPPSDEKWNSHIRLFWIVTPPFFGLFILITAMGWDGFSIMVGSLPLPALIVMIGAALSLLVVLTSTSQRAPKHYWLLSILSFASAICWLNVIAGEVVSVLQSLGVMFGISTAILGLTVLAVGNSVGDWVSDTTVARSGSPETAVASCFGSPLLNDVVGLGVSLTISTARSYPEPFHIAINNRVKIAWAFLGTSLVSSLIAFIVSKYHPPKKFGVFLIVLYVGFVALAVADEEGAFGDK